MAGKDADEQRAALEELFDGAPSGATAEASDDELGGDDDDWLGLGDSIAITTADLGDRYQVEAVLRRLSKKIHSSGLDEILIGLKDDLQTLFGAERVTIYVADGLKKEIYSKTRSGEDVVEFRVPIGPKSLAGFVAATGRWLSVADAYDDAAVKAIHPHLNFDVSWDQKTGFRTRQVLAVPIKVGRRIEGVIQLVNREEPGGFTKGEKRILMEVAESLAVAFTNQKRLSSRRSKFDRLFSMQLVSEDMVDEAEQQAQKDGASVEQVLTDRFHVPKKEILSSLSEYFRVPPIEFTEDWVTPEAKILDQFTVEFLKHHRACPLGNDVDGRLIVAFTNPKDIPLRDTISRRLERRVEPRVAIAEDVRAFVERFYPAPEEGAPAPAAPASALTDLVAEIEDESGRFAATEKSPEEEAQNDSGLMKLVNQIIEHAHQRGVSDIHIEPYPDADIEVRYRIDGVCQLYTRLPRRLARAMISRIKIMADLDIAERRLPQDGKIKFRKYSNLDIELRVATLPTVGGLEDCVMRILAASKPLPLEKMGFMPDTLERFLSAVTRPYGLVLVVGPTGSGKTTTLHSALAHINKPETKIWTAEDPVEITQAGLRQVQVLPKIGLDFARVLRAFLRADPDVIMIGEMRDQETAEAGVEASLTGHLVFSTLHTNSAPETVTRLLDMGLDPYSFGDSLLGVLAQRLIRRLCACKKPLDAPAETLAELEREYDYPAGWKALGLGEGAQLFRPDGCPQCDGKGYRGRMGIHEFMLGTDALRALVYQQGKVAELRAQALAEGMTTLKQDGIRKVLLGNSDIHEVRRVCIK